MGFPSRTRAVAFLCAQAVLALSLSVAPPAYASAPESEEPAYAGDQAIVAWERGDRPEAAEAIEGADGEVISANASGDFYVVETPTDSGEWARELEDQGTIRYAEPDYVVEATELIPDDPLWSQMWGLEKVGAPEAWVSGGGGGEAIVGVIDSGVDYTHEDLVDQMWVNPGEVPNNHIDDDGNGYVDDIHGIDCASNDTRPSDTDPMDENGHGTHVAGTIGAEGNNSIGVPGVDWDVRIMALRFLGSSGSGSTSNAIECLDYATEMGARITNDSWGGAGSSLALSEAIQRAEAAGSIFVAAAGNSDRNLDLSPAYPASYPFTNVVSVAASTPSDGVASFSNHGGLTVDLAAPGTDILSTFPVALDHDGSVDGYARLDGTSMAAPHVAGAAAWLWSEDPDAEYEEILDRLYDTAAQPAGLEGEVIHGRLDLAAAAEVDAVAPGGLSLIGESAGPTSVTVQWEAPHEDDTSGGRALAYHLSYSPTGLDQWATAPAPRPLRPGTEQRATIEGLKPATTYDFRIRADDNAGNAGESSVPIPVLTGDGVSVFYDDVEAGLDGWSALPSWAATTEAPHSGTRSWSDSPASFYPSTGDVVLLTDAFSLTGVTDPRLTFWHRYDTQFDQDFAIVEIATDGGSWNELARFSGQADEYQAVVRSLDEYESAASARIRFRLVSNDTSEADGWYIDDVLVSGSGTDLLAPSLPTGLTATPSTAGVSLDWADNSEVDLDGYNVYRKLPSASSWTKLNGPLLTVSTVADPTGVAGTIYQYRVAAVDLTGNEGAPSSIVTAAKTAVNPGGGGGGGGGGSSVPTSVATPTSPPVPEPIPSATIESVSGSEFTRMVSLRLRRHLVAAGRVDAPGAPSSCFAGVRVNIRRDGQQVAHTFTKDDGTFRVRIPDRNGRYVAVLPLLTTGGAPPDVCLGARSKSRLH
jgi:subtilisin family serine protease